MGARRRISGCWIVMLVLALSLGLASAALAAPAGTIFTVAGQWPVEGPATTLGQMPTAVLALPGGSMLVADEGNVRAVTANGYERTVVGTGIYGDSGDGGPAGSAQVYAPSALGRDAAGDVLIGDDSRVRLVAAADCSSACPFGLDQTIAGHIYTVAGGGNLSPSTDGTPARLTQFGTAGSLGIDPRGDLIVAASSPNAPMDLTTHLALLAASPCTGAACPFGLANMSTGYVYALPATSGLSSATVDAGGDVITAGTDGVRLLAARDCGSGCPYGLTAETAGQWATIVPNGSPTQFKNVSGLAVDPAGNLLVADSNLHTVRVVPAADCSADCPYGLSAATAGGLYPVATLGDPSDRSQFYPWGLAVDANDNVLIISQNRVLMRAAAGCSATCGYGLGATVAGGIYPVAGNGTRVSGDGGPAATAGLTGASGLAFDVHHNLLIADTGDDEVRVVAGETCVSHCPWGMPAMQAGNIYRFAGAGPDGISGDGVPARTADIQIPNGVTLDPSGDALILTGALDSQVRMVAARSCSTACPFGLAATTAGDLYTVAGLGFGSVSGTQFGGPAASAPLGVLAGVAFDRAGDLLLADRMAGRVELVANAGCSHDCPYGLAQTTAGHIYSIVGTGTSGPTTLTAGPASADVVHPLSLSADRWGDAVFGDDTGRIWLLAAADCNVLCPYGLPRTREGWVYPIAGNGGDGYFGDGGPALAAEFHDPGFLLGDADGNLLIADGDDRIRMVAGGCLTSCPYGLDHTVPGYVYTVAGTGASGHSGDGGPATAAALFQPLGMALDGGGDLFVSDGYWIRSVIGPAQVPVNVSLSGSGSGIVASQPNGLDCLRPQSAGCQSTAGSGSVVTLSARARSGSAFTGWAGDGCRTGPHCKIRLVRAARVTARFVRAGRARVVAVRVRGASTAVMVLTCRGTRGAACLMQVRLSAGRVVLSGRSVSIAAGHQLTVHLRVGSAGRRLLARHHRLRARLVVTQSGVRRAVTARAVELG